MLNKLKKIDLGIIFILLALMAASTLLVHSATYGNPEYANYDVKTMIFYGAGFGIALCASFSITACC